MTVLIDFKKSLYFKNIAKKGDLFLQKVYYLEFKKISIGGKKQKMPGKKKPAKPVKKK